MGAATVAKLNRVKKELEQAKKTKEGLDAKKKKVVQAQLAAAQQAVKASKNQTKMEQARNAELTAALFKQQYAAGDAATTLAIRAGNNAQGIASSRAKAAFSAVNESGIVGQKVQNVLEAINNAATGAVTSNTNRVAAENANDALTSPGPSGISSNVLLLGGVGAGAILLVVVLKKKKGKK